MPNFSDLLEEINGNGYTEVELLEITEVLTDFVVAKEKIMASISALFDEDELSERLMNLSMPSLQQQMTATLLKDLSPRERQCFLMPTVQNMTFSQIAKELGFTKGATNVFMTRARKKLGISKKESGR